MTATARFSLFLAALVSSTAFAGAAHAASAIGLVDGTKLVMFDTETRSVSDSVDIAGVEALAGIDVRPADKMLYGVTLSGEIVTIDPASGEASVKATLSENLPSYEGAIVDFNPVADRLRLMGRDGTNHRVNVDDGMVTVDGSLAFEAGDMHEGEAPDVVAAAYTNSLGKPEETKMFDIDATIVALLQQVSPNDGTLAAIGKLGVEGGGSYAFDIASTTDWVNTAYLVVDNVLHTVNLDTGAAESWGEIEGVDGIISDIAIVP